MRWFKRPKEGKGAPDTESRGAEPGQDLPKDAPDAKGSYEHPAKKALGRPAKEGRTEPPKEPAAPEAASAEPDMRAKQAQADLDALHAKIASVKKEYNEAVGSLFEVKGELTARRRESAAANATCETLQKRVKALNSQLAESESHRAQVHTSNKTRQDASRELEKVNEMLDKKQQDLESAQKKIAAAAAELDAVREKERASRERTAESERLLVKTRAMIREENSSRPAPKGDIVRTASSMIATLNAKLAKANEEIRVLQDIIDRERRQRAQAKS